MASEWSKKKQNSSYRGKFQWLFVQGKGNLVRVSGEFEVWRFRFNRVKTSRKWDEIRGKLDVVRVSGEVRVIGFYCIYKTYRKFTSWNLYLINRRVKQNVTRIFIFESKHVSAHEMCLIFLLLFNKASISYSTFTPGPKPPSKLTLACCKFLLIYYNKWL